MARVFRYKNFNVYVGDERGARHHLPHAHVKERKTLICSINLITLEPMHPGAKLPAGLLGELRAHHDELVEKWEELNS